MIVILPGAPPSGVPLPSRLVTADRDTAVAGPRVEDRTPAVRPQARDKPRDQRQVHAADHVPVPFGQLMHRRESSINDVAIEESQRRIFGPRPAAERGTEFPIR